MAVLRVDPDPGHPREAPQDAQATISKIASVKGSRTRPAAVAHLPQGSDNQPSKRSQSRTVVRFISAVFLCKGPLGVVRCVRRATKTCMSNFNGCRIFATGPSAAFICASRDFCQASNRAYPTADRLPPPQRDYLPAWLLDDCEYNCPFRIGAEMAIEAR